MAVPTRRLQDQRYLGDDETLIVHDLLHPIQNVGKADPNAAATFVT